MDLQALFNQALHHHQQGNLVEAERLYRHLLAADAANGAANYYLGTVLAQQGRSEESLVCIRASLAANPDVPEIWMVQGQILAALGNNLEALSSYDRAQQLAPRNAAILNGRGIALYELGRFREAVQSYDQSLAVAPSNAEVFNNRGNAFRKLDRLPEALISYNQALEIKPDYAGALYNRAVVQRQCRNFEEALGDYNRALQLRPDFLEALIGRGKTLRDLGRQEEALGDFKRAVTIAPEDSDAANGLAVGLYETGEIETAFAMYRNHAALVYGSVSTPSKTDDPAAAGIFHLDPGARVAGAAINPQNATGDVAQKWQTSRPQILVVDDFLTPEALAGIRHFCLTSTVWQKRYDAGYLGATPEHGFACPLLAQIAEELPATFQDVFQSYPLQYLWAFKYDSRLSGINIHADFAAVNVNFWITPDDANLDPDTGGLVIWDKAAPREWDFSKYNVDEPAIRSFLAETAAQPVVIPYRANRAVIFDSDLFHETDKFYFKEGNLNQRINITLLYGLREMDRNDR
jgi:tetratricopeptide (TPR) repeat protein